MTLKPLEFFKNYEVAALAWAIRSAPLMANGGEIEFVGEEWCEEMYRHHEAWLKNLDADPLPLRTFLQQENAVLIGKKFEQLLAYWFLHSPRFRLVERNVVLSERGNTRAEIDFIVEDLDEGTLMHLEVACKYYLQLNGSRQWKDWPGPNGNDSLLIKMQKLSKQTTVFNTTAGMKYLAENGLVRPHSYAFMKGIFFHHFSEIQHSVAPAGAHPHYNSGWYCHLHELTRFAGNTRQWIILPAWLWMCPYRFDKVEEMLLSGHELPEHCSQIISRRGKSVMVVQVACEQGLYVEVSRGMVISDHFSVK
jgi:hypothetical protein